ncbi:Phage protein [Streptococcus pneumoniae]|nr:Phage protein [Streptococcus pneumoniae]VJF03681.1 Phage protein [Streptococcus pneumoniae]VJF63392.1 Phage protein [Streptococcus pneumoniae]VJG32443.1 Phage protein [Streptococcus pneumoniae]VJG65943.1 Phage protein [Streptococcus pneumoniae]
MRPRRYPYSGKKESTFMKADPELVEKILRNISFLEHLQVVLATKL